MCCEKERDGCILLERLRMSSVNSKGNLLLVNLFGMAAAVLVEDFAIVYSAAHLFIELQQWLCVTT